MRAKTKFYDTRTTRSRPYATTLWLGDTMYVNSYNNMTTTWSEIKIIIFPLNHIKPPETIVNRVRSRSSAKLNHLKQIETTLKPLETT